jgi:hypothetical protein
MKNVQFIDAINYITISIKLEFTELKIEKDMEFRI